MQELTLNSPAKINLYLKIIKKIENGYHELDTDFQLIDLHDTIIFKKTNQEICVTSNNDQILGKNNIVYKVAEMMQSKNLQSCGVNIHIEKTIPIGAGLGGGSSNAASTILALNKLWELNLTKNEIHEIAVGIGADVPFFLYGANAYAKGIGNEFEFKESVSGKFVVIDPLIFNSTKEMFDSYDLIDVKEDFQFKQNSFWQVFMDKNSEIEDFYKKNIKKFDICLSGSGSAMFIKYNNDIEMGKILKIIPTNWRFFLAKPLQYSPLRSLDDIGV